jgi:anti-sigma regulatory factor (Ser/Thr protein kinase)
MSAIAGSRTEARVGFWHEALFYEGDDEFIERTAAFVDDGRRAGEPVLVVAAAPKVERLRARLGADTVGVTYADMDDVGRNPALIIPAWRQFLAEHAGNGPVRGIGEPIHAGRTGDELVECHVHEALLNRAFADIARDFRLMCPYDTRTLARDVVATARDTHPYVANGHGACARGAFDDGSVVDRVLRLPLSPVPANAVTYVFSGDDLSELRAVSESFAERAGVPHERVGDFVLGVHEVAVNSVHHGPGRGVLSLWEAPDRVLAQVDDTGRFSDPLAGRLEPDVGACSGRGLWLTNRLFDLVQIRSFASGAVVRMHFVTR